jgi:hypothetical protein
MRDRLLWVIAGAAGLVLAAGIGLATASLTRAPVGLSAEPVSAGQALAPKSRPKARSTPRPHPTPTATPTPVEPDADDSSGRGRGRGRSDDDD